MAKNKIFIDIATIGKVVEFSALSKTINEHMEQLASTCAKTSAYMGEKEHQILMDHVLDLMNNAKFIYDCGQLILEKASMELISQIMNNENGDSDS